MALTVRDSAAVDNVMRLRTWARTASKMVFFRVRTRIDGSTCSKRQSAPVNSCTVVTFFITSGTKRQIFPVALPQAY